MFSMQGGGSQIVQTSSRTKSQLSVDPVEAGVGGEVQVCVGKMFKPKKQLTILPLVHVLSTHVLFAANKR